MCFPQKKCVHKIVLTSNFLMENNLNNLKFKKVLSTCLRFKIYVNNHKQNQCIGNIYFNTGISIIIVCYDKLNHLNFKLCMCEYYFICLKKCLYAYNL